jgi:hypothetical protein
MGIDQPGRGQVTRYVRGRRSPAIAAIASTAAIRRGFRSTSPVLGPYVGHVDKR